LLEQLKPNAGLVARFMRAALRLSVLDEAEPGKLRQPDAVHERRGDELLHPLTRDLAMAVRWTVIDRAEVATEDVASTRLLLNQGTCQGEVEARALGFFHDYLPLVV
jgi:hypothetical protein